MQTETLTRPSKSGAIPIKHILVPVDFSPASTNALDYALQIGEAFGSKITLLHVVESDTIPGSPDPPSAFEEVERYESEKKLRELISSLERTGSAVEFKMATGVSGHEIIETAKVEDIDLIVIATHGLTAWKHFCIGSTAERVARAACCPVLVVREKEREFI